MASIDFPSSPTDGQTLTSGNATYTYVAAKGYWDAIAAPSGIQLTSLSVGPEGAPSGDGDISYDNTTGVFTYTPPVISTFDGIITLGTITEKTSLPVDVVGSLGSQQKIQASANLTTAQFGYSVSISGDGLTAIVGANGTGNGAAYVYTRSTALSTATWTQQAKIVASDGQLYDYFGASVSISSDGNTVIVGADYEDPSTISNAGAAYIFTRSGTTWTQQAKIVASDPEASDGFGFAVSISGDGNTVIVGALNEDTGESNAGAAYIFTRSGTSWTQQAKIQSTDIQAGDYFGYSVSISNDGNTAIVGAWYEDDGATDAGAAYIFTRSGTSWTQQAKIQAGDKQTSDQFGVSVSISDDGLTAIIGANGEDTGASAAGAAYIFTRSGTTWSQQAKIQASDPEASDNFGWSVSISSDGNTAIVSAWIEDPAGTTNAGSAYVFKRSGTTWTETQKIQASDAEVSDYFGMSVGISGDGSAVIVGARGEDTGASDAGAAYIYAAEVSSIVLHDISQSSIFTHSGLAADFTANFTNVPTTNDRTIEIELVIEQGATGYLPAAIQIDGAAQTFVWENGVTPTPSVNASDVVKFTLLRSADTWTVLASLTRFTDAAYPAGGIALTDFSVGAENPASGDGAISYDNTTGVFTYTPPVISGGGIALTDFSVGAENPASGDGAISYDNTTGVFTYTPPVIGASGVDAASVEAAGALMDSELTNIVAVKALNQRLSTTDSPSFAGLTLSGVPTAPTAASGTTTAQIATTQFTTSAINAAIATATNFVNRIYNGNGVTTNFVVTSGVTSESILVSDNGVVQRPITDYSVSGTTLTFVSAPLTGSTIQIREIPVGIRGDGIALASLSVGAENPASGDGAISYNNTTGVFTYTPPVIGASGVDAASVEAAGALMDSELTDIVAIKALDQGVATTDSPNFTGLTVFGTTALDGITTLSTTTETISSPVLVGSIATHDISQSSIFTHSGLSANFTANFTNAPTTSDRTISVALIINQGSTGYLPTAVQIDGVAQTILWQGALAPSPTTNATDIVTFTLIRSGVTLSLLGTVTAFGSV